jgi:diacylglycerol kinase family enzyme
MSAARPLPPGQAGAAPDGAVATARRWFVVMNAGSGRHAARQRKQLVETMLGERGHRCSVVLARGARQLTGAIRRQSEAARTENGVLVGAGGDGTLNAVAARAHALELPFAALPQGTFNFFGRNLGLSEDLADAAVDLHDVVEHPVQVGEVNGRIFLVNASIGLYRRLLQDRERYKQRYGRSRLVALWAGLNTLLRWHPRLSLRMEGEDGAQVEDLLTFIAGNNRLQLEQLGLPGVEVLAQGSLLGIKLGPQPRSELIPLALRGLAGRWANSHSGTSFGFRELVIDPVSRRRRSLRVGIDGEIVSVPTPLHFRVSPTPLRLLLPRHCLPNAR